MHWVIGKRRLQHGSAVEAARKTARATRYAVTIGLLGTLATVGVAVAAELVDGESGEVSTCTAAAIYDYQHLYDARTITAEEFHQLRADAIADQLADTGDC